MVQAADPKGGRRVKVGAGGVTVTVPNNYVMAAPDTSQQNYFTEQAAAMEAAWGLSKQQAMQTGGTLRAEYANTMAASNAEKIRQLAATENAAVARGVLGSSADYAGRLGVRAQAQFEANQAANALRAGLEAKNMQLQADRLTYDTARSNLELGIVGAGADQTAAGYSAGLYDEPVTDETDTGQGQGQGGWRGFATGQAEPDTSTPTAQMLRQILNNFPEVYQWVKNNRNKQWGAMPNVNDPQHATRQQARKMWRYLYENQYGE